MVGALLLRGMLIGVVAGILGFAFLKIVGEPNVERAIAFEKQMEAVKDDARKEEAVAKGLPTPVEDPDPELVSRPVQSGVGLFTAVVVYGAAFGGLFALAFALAYRRMGDFGPRTTSALLALSGIVAISVVPGLKYPANPPSVGEAETIGMRTGLYFAVVAISLAAMIAAWMARHRLVARFGAWDAALLAGAGYLVAVAIVALALPSVNEVPEAFPAVVLWQFRIASLGAQILMWAVIGLAFGALSERAAMRRNGLRLKAGDVLGRTRV